MTGGPSGNTPALPDNLGAILCLMIHNKPYKNPIKEYLEYV